MKIRSILLLTMASFLLYLPAHGQLDTLYFDDFIDNRDHWESDGFEWQQAVFGRWLPECGDQYFPWHNELSFILQSLW
jgi:hypothetical protein